MKQTIGKFLATLRKAKGLTQEEVADELNISNKTLSSWETDRTTPDALTLPAIADLYEVTVDEILRGERAKGNEQAQISEKAKRALTKKKYGKFSVKHFMFTGFGMLAIVLNVLGLVFLLYTFISSWVGILLSIVGFCGVVTLTILLCFFEYTTLLSEGMLDGNNAGDNPDDELNGNSLALCMKRKTSRSLKLFSLPYLAFTVATMIYWFTAGAEFTLIQVDTSQLGMSVTVDRSSLFLGFILASGIVGLTYLIWGISRESAAVKKHGQDVQRTTHKKNKKLFRILSIVCSSIIAACLTVAIVFTVVPINVLRPTWYDDNDAMKVYTRNFEEFRDIAQTLILDDETVAKFNLPSNKFVLKLPDGFDPSELKAREQVDLGNGFYGSFKWYSWYSWHGDCTISYKIEEISDEETGETQDVYYPIIGRDVVKVYHDRQQKNYDYVVYLPQRIQAYQSNSRGPKGELAWYFYNASLIYYSVEDHVGKNFLTGKYGFYAREYYYVFPFVWCCVAVIVGVDLGVCTIVYWKKRKKIIYKI